MYEDFVALAASPRQNAINQSKRDAVRVKNASNRFKKTVDAVFPSNANLERLFERAWSWGEILGNSAARKQAKALKLPKPKAVKADKVLHDSLKADLKRVLKEAKGISSDDSEWSGLLLRAKMVVEAATKMSATSALENAVRSKDTQKMWLTTSSVPCSHCKRLDGVVVDWGKQFPKDFKGIKPLKSYRNTLLEPPRHPNCGCIVVVVFKNPDNIIES